MIVDFGHSVSDDYIKWLSLSGGSIQTLPMSEKSANTSSQVSNMVVFIQGRLADKITPIIELVKRYSVKHVSIISTLQSHFSSGEAIEIEETFLQHLEAAKCCGVIFRCGYILSDRSIAQKNLRRFAFVSPLIPSRLRSCCVSGEEVFEAIDAERNSPLRHSRIITLLGPNRPWQELLQDYCSDNQMQILLRGFCFLLSFLLLDRLIAFLLSWSLELKLLSNSWNFNTLKPKSMGELLSLVNKYNFKYVKVVGYNNAVNHFGYNYPDKTVISTVNCHRIIRTADNIIKVDCGATILQTLDFLAEEQQELYSIPNYSYVSMGTAFFVPIHGNSLDYTITAEKIIKVVLYDPKEERFIVTSRGETTFQHYLFNTKSEIVLLRLYIQVKPKARYFLSQDKLSNPNSQTLLDAFCNDTATNIDIRKSNAKSDTVYINKYYDRYCEKTDSQEFELPRDSIGSLWDKLEQRQITSWLIHAPIRYLFWNVEVFLSKEEFIKFWETHTSLPIRKIELRYKKCNRYLNLPFRESDRIAVDFIVLRKHRQEIEEYLVKNFAPLHYHLGKHH